MSPLQCARQEWEDSTKPFPKNHWIGKDCHVDDFRLYSGAIAWIEWGDGRIFISKLEALQTSQGAAARLVEFLKALADKYHLHIVGRSKVYPPDPPAPEGPLLSQEQLDAWYQKRGFQLRKIRDNDASDFGYPDIPPEG